MTISNVVSKEWRQNASLKRISRACHSAWGPDADRRGNSLNCLRKEGSNSEADSHAWSRAAAPE
jgi:hypothetical protein